MFGNAIGFPILTFDEAKLAPSWGYVFDARWIEPFESVVSILWKLVWINRLAGHSVVTHVARNSVDPYIGIGTTLTELDGKYLASVLGVRLKVVRQSVPNPISRRAASPVLRYCVHCMARGYHSVLHQFDGVQRCPIHFTLLETHCRRCGAQNNYRIDARILDAPFKCPDCRRPYASSWSSFTRCGRLHVKARAAVTRASIGG